MAKTDEAGLVRVNTRIGEHHNKFLDDYARKTGMSKSGLIQLAVDRFMRETETMSTMEQVIQKLEDLESKIEK